MSWLIWPKDYTAIGIAISLIIFFLFFRYFKGTYDYKQLIFTVKYITESIKSKLK